MIMALAGEPSFWSLIPIIMCTNSVAPLFTEIIRELQGIFLPTVPLLAAKINES